ncbi:hypothetical protein D3C78_329310 [compost metagenome]
MSIAFVTHKGALFIKLADERDLYVSPSRRAIVSVHLLGCTAGRVPELASMRDLLSWLSHAVRCQSPAGIDSGLSRLRFVLGTVLYPVDYHWPF